MFELGIRLAFDKPTIIIKDDKTSYSFDTAPIEHLVYPRDLRFSQIVDFKQTLSLKIKSTHSAATTDKNYTTFLKHFGEFTVAKLSKKEIPEQQFILEELRALGSAVRRLEHKGISDDTSMVRRIQGGINVCMKGNNEAEILEAYEFAKAHPGVRDVIIEEIGKDHKHIIVDVQTGYDVDRRLLRNGLRNRSKASGVRLI